MELDEGKIYLTGQEKSKFIYAKGIRTIVTKEQFENIAYRIYEE